MSHYVTAEVDNFSGNTVSFLLDLDVPADAERANYFKSLQRREEVNAVRLSDYVWPVDDEDVPNGGTPEDGGDSQPKPKAPRTYKRKGAEQPDPNEE